MVTAIVGVGGAFFTGLGSNQDFIKVRSLSFGFLNIDVTNNGKTLNATFLANDATTKDQFSITKTIKNPPIDTIPPRILSTIPIDGFSSTPDNTMISATFNEPIMGSTVNTTSVLLTDNTASNSPVSGTVSLSFRQLDYNIHPFIPRAYTRTHVYSQNYHRNKGFAGNPMTSNYQWTFTVIQSKYLYAPSLTLSGSNYSQVLSNPSLQLSTFSVSTWFKTGFDFSGEPYIVNKGGTGSESAGKNMNYGIWMTSGEKLRAGFETTSGTDVFVTSSSSYKDDKWHYATVTFDGSALRLYVDGIPVGALVTSLLPDNTGTQPVRIGANSLANNGYFTGNIDEVRVYNIALTPTEVTDAYNGIFTTMGQVLYLPFNVDTSKYHYAPSLTLSGSNYSQVLSNPSLQLSTFSVSTWFKTGFDFSGEPYIVNKGGTGSESAGKNMNYGIWMTSGEKLRAGFETTSGTDVFVTSSSSYKDDKWHYATVTFDGSALRLYVDGIPVGALVTSLLPDNTGT